LANTNDLNTVTEKFADSNSDHGASKVETNNEFSLCCFHVFTL